MERIEFDLLFRWFVGLGVGDPVWDLSSFTKNRDRLLEGEIAAKFLTALLSSEPFSVDGTLVQAWASMKSLEPKQPPGTDGGCGARRSAIDRRTTRHPGYAKSQRVRKRIEEAFGWIKGVGGLHQTKLRGLSKVDWAFTFAASAYDLVRLPKLIGATT